MRGASGEASGDSRQDLTNRIPTYDLDQQRANRSGTGRNSSVSNVLFQPQSPARVGVERSRNSVAPNRRGKSSQRIQRFGTRQALGK